MYDGLIIERFRSSDLMLSKKEILRLLGGGQNRVVRPSVAQLIEEELATAAEIVDSRAVILFGDHGLEGLTTSFLVPESPCAAAVCTIGGAVETRVEHLFDRGERARAVIADAVASVAAESTADACDRAICRRARDVSLKPGRRRSPGYGNWPLEDQRVLFDMLEPSAIGVTLTDRFMMVPRKSVSFVVALDGAAADNDDSSRCSLCELDACPYRRRVGDDTARTRCH